MKLKAIQAIPGEIYLTPTGTRVTVLPNEKNLRENGQVVPLIKINGDDGYVVIRIEESKKVEEYHMMALLDDGRVRRHQQSSGAPKKADATTPWRGWAYRHEDLMKFLINAAKSKDFVFVPAYHYFRATYKARTEFVIFKNGILGYHLVPPKCLSAFPITKSKNFEKTKTTYVNYTINLHGIWALGLWKDFTSKFQQSLNDLKNIQSKSYRASI